MLYELKDVCLDILILQKFCYAVIDKEKIYQVRIYLKVKSKLNLILWGALNSGIAQSLSLLEPRDLQFNCTRDSPPK